MFGKKLSTSCRRDTLLSALHKKNRFWGNCGKLGGFPAAVTDSCVKLSGATFTIFGVSFHNKNFKEQFSLATFGAFWSLFEGPFGVERLQLWGNQFGQPASGSNFEAQLSGAALQNGFGEPFLVQTRSLRAVWKTAFGTYLWRSTVEHLWGATA